MKSTLSRASTPNFSLGKGSQKPLPMQKGPMGTFGFPRPSKQDLTQAFNEGAAQTKVPSFTGQSVLKRQGDTATQSRSKNAGRHDA